MINTVTSAKIKVSKLTQFWPIICILVVNIAIGLATFQDYGESVDEPRLREYASQSVAAYKSWITPSYSPDFGGDDLRYYGSAFIMGVELSIRLVGILPSSVLATDLWHLAYFITFQVAVLCIYLLGKRWLSDWAAFGITLLFSTQPLLWGHAFINPKDTPFLAFFLASIVTGLWMCDRAVASSDNNISSHLFFKYLITQGVKKWHNKTQRSKNAVIIVSLIWVLSTVLLVFGTDIFNSWIAIFVHKGYTAEPLSLVGRLFSRFAHHANNIHVENYILKAQTLFRYFQNSYFILGTVLIFWLYRSVLPWSIRLPYRTEISSFIRECGRSFTAPPILIAGMVLGLTTSVRALGPLAGMIVVLYALFKRKKILVPFLVYAIIALVAMYLTWPYLWSAPFSHLMESITTMSNFPWLGQVLFNGNYYPSTDLPRSYLPILLSIQFTVPVVILFGIGCIIAIYNLIFQNNSEVFGIALIWFFIPISILIITRRPIYDNFRQLLFLVPPIFLFCGIALDAIFHFARKWSIKMSILILLIYPGVYSGLYLHPYEYIYYNGFVGGVEGAFRKYETDYWMTSYRESAEYLNNAAEQNAKIVAWGGYQLVKQYTRPDLIVEPENGNTYNLRGGYNYAVLSSRGGNDDLYPNEPSIYTVIRGNAILGVVKHLSPSSSPFDP
jgi:hypothetical protein